MEHYMLMHEIVGGITYWGCLILVWLLLNGPVATKPKPEQALHYAPASLHSYPMKLAALVWLLTTLPYCLLASTTPVQVGWSEAEVVQALGQPIGILQLRERVRWLYPQGELTLENGAVSEINLMEAEAFAAHQEQIAEERAAWQAPGTCKPSVVCRARH